MQELMFFKHSKPSAGAKLESSVMKHPGVSGRVKTFPSSQSHSSRMTSVVYQECMCSEG